MSDLTSPPAPTAVATPVAPSPVLVESAVAELQKSCPTSTKQITFVVPAYNEGEGILDLIKAVYDEMQKLPYDYELLIIDDGSKDDTIEKIGESPYPARLLRLSRNFGKENAMTAGLDFAQGDAVILMDADLQHPIHLIHEFVSAWEQGAEMVYGVRQERQDQPWLLRNFSFMFYKMLEASTATSIPRGAGDFRLMDRRVVEAIRALPERDRFMKGIFGWVGFRTQGVPFQAEERVAGESTFNFKSLFSLAVTGVTSFSVLPLRVWALVGMVVSAFAIFYGVYLSVRTVLYGVDVPGWSTLIISILFLGGIQLISIGVLGEYLGRVFDEVKRRPRYLIAEDVKNDASERDDS